MLPVWRVSNRAIEAKFHASPPASIQPVSLRHTATNAVIGEDRGGWGTASPIPTFQELAAEFSALLVVQQERGARHVLIFRRGSLLMGWQPTALAVIWFGANSSSHSQTPGAHTGQNTVTDNSTLAVDNV